MPRLPRAFSPLRHRDFRLLWSGSLVSSVGTWMQRVAQGWLVLTLTGSPFWLGVDAFLGEAPFLAFSLFGGVLADRAERRRILVASQLVQMGCALALAGLIVTERVTLGSILGLSFLSGLATAFGAPAFQAFFPTLVPQGEIPKAIALNSIQFNLARVAGPGIAGLAFERIGAAGCMTVNGLSFLAVVLALLAIPRRPAAGGGGASVLEGLKEGVGVVFRRPDLRGLVGLAFLGSFCSIPLVTFLPVFAKEVFRGGAGRYSALLAAFGCGAVLGGIVVAATASRMRRRGLLGAVGLLVYGLLTAAFGVSRSPSLSFAFLVAAGACLMVVFSSFMTLVQTSVDDALRGRVVSIYGLAFRGGMPLGNLAAGTAAAAVGAPAVLVACGAVLAVTGGIVAARRREGGVAGM
ncbi:MAG: MFS transporter [Thermoanaerobaculia bacterium]|nr:MFS transporter [Thermoanaerobaculia bacterium]